MLSIILSPDKYKCYLFWMLHQLTAWTNMTPLFPEVHFIKNRSIGIRIFLCVKAPHTWVNTAAHSPSCLWRYQVLSYLSSLHSSELQISLKAKEKLGSEKQPGAVKCPVNPDSRRGNRRGAGQSSQLLENMKYRHSKSERVGEKGRMWDSKHPNAYPQKVQRPGKHMQSVYACWKHTHTHSTV